MLGLRPRRWAAAAVLVALLGAPALVGHASAQDPYGSTSTVPPSVSGTVSCSTSNPQGQPGDTVTVTLTDVPAGEVVRVLFGGVEVSRAEEPAGPDPLSTVTISYIVPDMPPSSYVVAAVGDSFTAECSASFTLVEGNSLARPDDGGGGSGALPRTGIYVGLLIAIALVLLVVGRGLLEGARRRRRRARAAANRVRLLVPHTPRLRHDEHVDLS